MLRNAAGDSSLFWGIGKSPVTMETASPRARICSAAARTSSPGVCIPTWEARMHRAA